MIELTIGHVAGLIALGIFIAQVWCPTWLMFLLAGLLGDKEPAATWTVAGRALQSSYWPDVLRTDATRTNGVRKSIVWVNHLSPALAVLCAIAGVVTPLGLYDALEPSGQTSVSFRYVRDGSSYGVATPSRSNLPWSRVCSMGHGIFSQGPYPCPYSNSPVIFSWNGTTYEWQLPLGYNSTLPNILREIYGSGTRNDSTISNYFDIEWRSHSTVQDQYKNNGSTILVSDFRPFDSLILETAPKAIEGLVVDTVQGGVGFRNHTLPFDLSHGASWSEDLLFVEPVSACVDTNISLQFTINRNRTGTERRYSELYLVDDGGFIDLNTTYPTYDHWEGQTDPELQARAYKAAWLTNVWSMAFFNITNPNTNTSTGEKDAFAYIDSFKGKKISIPRSNEDIYDALRISRAFDGYIPYEDPTYDNPFNISTENFGNILVTCAGSNGGEIANSSSIYVNCGVLQGVPKRIDGGQELLMEGGSTWKAPLYTCASALRANIKSVAFNMNGTSGIDSLYIKSIDRKNHTADNMPLWGFEETGLTLDGVSPIWGLVDPVYTSYPNISVFRKESLYLPGAYDDMSGLRLTRMAGSGLQYLPGSDFAPAAMNNVYDMGDSQTVVNAIWKGFSMDYLGTNNVAMNLKWRDFSSTPQDAAKIVNLIWTDLSASAVVGTKGNAGVEKAAGGSSLIVRPIRRRIKYHVPFAVPAFLLAAVLVVLGVLALIARLRGQSNLALLRRRLNQSSTGRLLTTLLDVRDSWAMPSREWSLRHGGVEFDLSEDGQVTVVSGGEPKMDGSPGESGQQETGLAEEINVQTGP